jgi:uncharacterized MAPEG superfamily protein
MQEGELVAGYVAMTLNPAFQAYAGTCLLLTLNLLALWMSSGIMRARSGVAINPEDGARFGVGVAELDPPVVARVLRVHRNAEATIYPFLLLGLVYVLAGARVQAALPIFAAFVVARFTHSIVYLKGLQPWRTIAFVASILAIVVLMVALIRLLLAG